MSHTEKYYLPEGRLYANASNRDLLSLSSAEGLLCAVRSGDIFEAVPGRCDSRLSLHFDFYGIRGIMEKKEAMYCRPGEIMKDIAIITRVGKPVCFKVLSVERDRHGEYAVLSRRAAQLDCVSNYLSDLIPGDIIPARITHLESFGAFADIGCGVCALMTVDSISVSRISHPSDRLRVGEDIFCVVKSIDRENGRIFISRRELYGTWAENAARFEIGNTVSGIVRSIESYGVFVELAPNLAGLAELRERDNGRAAREVCVGQRVAVYIKNIIPEKMKVKLVIIDAFSDGDGKDIPCATDSCYIDGNAVRHIDRWLYSVPGAEKLVESVFSQG